MNIIYVDNYKEDEQKILLSLGVKCFRFSKDDMIKGNVFDTILGSTTYQVRSNKISSADYAAIAEEMAKHGISLTTSVMSFDILNDAKKQYDILKEFCPKSIIVDKTFSTETIMRLVEENQFTYPIFARTDVESAAKYVGVGGCTIPQKRIEEFERVLSGISENVKGYRQIILKEVVTIQKDPKTGSDLEFRAIGCGGNLYIFDFNIDEFSISPLELGLDVFARKALQKLAERGADGGIFVDVAVLEDGSKTVIECKNLLNGTIRSVQEFGIAALEHNEA